MWLMAIFVGFLMYLLSVYLYLNIFYVPLENGIVTETEYRKAYTTQIPIYQTVGKVRVITGYVTTHHPPSYNVIVKDLNSDDTEMWSTTNMRLGGDLSQNDTIQWDDANYNVLKGK